MLLFPRLPGGVAISLAAQLAKQTPEELQMGSSNQHTAMTFAPTGGNRVTPAELTELQGRIRKAAIDAGYPNASDTRKRNTFDATSGRILYEQMQITPTEASHQGVWMFMGCVLLPDVVRWRFPGSASNNQTSTERFLGGNRGMRNTFGRVWWRAYTLHQEDTKKPYELLHALGEDELVQIMERPNIAGNPSLARQIGSSFLTIYAQNKGVSRSDLFRDAMKRLRRQLPVISFDALDETVLKEQIDTIFLDSVQALRPSSTMARKGTPVAHTTQLV